MTKKFDLKPTLVLSAICVVMVALLAVVNLFTAPVIRAQQEAAANKALLEVLPEGKNFKDVDLTQYTLPASIEKAWSADGGYVFQSNVTGYKSGLIIMCGIGSDGKITGAKYIQSNETLHAEDGLGDRFVGHDKDSITIDIVAGSTATLTTGAYYGAIEDSLKAFAILNGGSVDLRPPEVILQEKLNNLLGTEGKTFTEWFRSEYIEGVDTVYTADGAYVLVIDEVFVAYDAEGTLRTQDVDATALATAGAAYDIIKASTLVKVEDLPATMPELFVEAYRSASGNYVIVTNGDGYGINGEDHASGEYIVVKVAISSDGAIIDTEVLSEEESKNAGGALLKNPNFINQFIGKDKVGVEGVDSSAGVTVTAVGYKNALKAAFDAFEILSGGEQE